MACQVEDSPMLEKIILDNFQCHKHLEVELEKITVIVGENGSGKSAALRAIKWLCYNNWDGKSGDQIRFDQDFTNVCGVFESRIIQRGKTRSTNYYKLDNQLYEAFGTGIPESISKVLNIIPDNYQGQYDPPFWLMLSAGQAASALNEIFNLTQIDQSMDKLARQVRENKSVVKVVEERLKEFRERKKKYDWAKQANLDLEKIERIHKEVEQLDKEIKEAEDLQCKLTMATRTQDNSQEQLSSLQYLLEQLEELNQIEQRIKPLQKILELQEDLCQKEKLLVSKEQQLKKILKDPCPLCGK
jgi:DNA repair protein SbcC/Rad50